MPKPSQIGDPHWLAQAAAIRSAVNLPPTADIALMGTATIANLAVGSATLATPPTVGQAGYQVFQMADTLVTDSLIYNATDYSFFHAYALYLDSLNPQGAQNPSATDTAQLKYYRGLVETGLTAYEQTLTTAFTAWKQAEALTPGAYPDFTNYLSATQWGAKIANISTGIEGNNALITAIMTKVYGTNYAVIDKMRVIVDKVRKSLTGNLSSWPSSMQVQATSGQLVVPNFCAFDPVPKTPVVAANYANFAKWVDTAVLQHVSGQPKHTIPLAPNLRSRARAVIDNAVPFFGTTPNAHVTAMAFRAPKPVAIRQSLALNVHTTVSTFGYDAMRLIPLTRGDWYDKTLMHDFKNPDRRKLPIGLIIAMYPGISVTMDNAALKSVMNAYNSSAGVIIGSLQARAGATAASGNTDFANLKVQGNTVSISSDAPEPVIIGLHLGDIASHHSARAVQ